MSRKKLAAIFLVPIGILTGVILTYRFMNPPLLQGLEADISGQRVFYIKTSDGDWIYNRSVLMETDCDLLQTHMFERMQNEGDWHWYGDMRLAGGYKTRDNKPYEWVYALQPDPDGPIEFCYAFRATQWDLYVAQLGSFGKVQTIDMNTMTGMTGMPDDIHLLYGPWWGNQY